jgi:anti-sigma factor RsiW
MTCRQLTDFLADYLADELPAAQRLAFELHLGVCPDCRRYLASYEATVRMGKAALQCGDDAIPAEVPDGLVKAILAARKLR